MTKKNPGAAAGLVILQELKPLSERLDRHG
jgi:hypothetical protein